MDGGRWPVDDGRWTVDGGRWVASDGDLDKTEGMRLRKPEIQMTECCFKIANHTVACRDDNLEEHDAEEVRNLGGSPV